MNRFGMVMRGPILFASMPRYPGRLSPPRRPSVLAAYLGIAGWQGALAMLALVVGLTLLSPAGPFAEFLLSLLAALVLGALSTPLYERAKQVWLTRHAAWESAMRDWHSLRYCSRCDQVFIQRR